MLNQALSWCLYSKKLHDFHIARNTSCLPPKFGISIVFHFSWDDFNTQEKLETMAMQNLGVGGGVVNEVFNVEMVKREWSIER